MTAPTTSEPRLLGAATGPLPAPWRYGGGPRLWTLRVAEHTERARLREDLLDPDERARCHGFVRSVDRDRYRVGHVVLRELLGAYLDGDPAAVRLVREPCPGCGGPHGRPAVAGGPLHFSLSHSGGAVLLGFADVPVGVDVETEPDAEATQDITAVLHPAERAEIAGLSPRDRPGAVARCWARKESYLKGVGIGLGEDPARTYVGTGPAPGAVPGWTLTDVPVLPGYAAACAVRTPGPPAAAPQTASRIPGNASTSSST
ncbi:4'-phosphopantetheinyl transferase family protein [Streptomyces sp. NPDC101490]|uniref:4'-phosphopantetheinyl transferase family protein n=1 Tax=Streptomyces sp. NPDC101490 TaxID=3366143 RepID=UPI0037FEE6AC